MELVSCGDLVGVLLGAPAPKCIPQRPHLCRLEKGFRPHFSRAQRRSRISREEGVAGACRAGQPWGRAYAMLCTLCHSQGLGCKLADPQRSLAHWRADCACCGLSSQHHGHQGMLKRSYKRSAFVTACLNEKSTAEKSQEPACEGAPAPKMTTRPRSRCRIARRRM